MEDSFNFNLLRISVAQILKSQGFDKCKPSILNIVTDLYINFFNKLVQESIKCSQQRTQTNDPELQDIMQSMINIGLIKSTNFLQLYDEYFEESKYNTKSINSFKLWILKSYGFNLITKLNRVPKNLIENLIEKRKINDDDLETELEKKRKKHKERQEFYNQLKLNDNDLIQKQIQIDENLENEEAKAKTRILNQSIAKMKWLNYLIEKNLKLGHNLKYLNLNEYILKEFLSLQNDSNFHPNSNENFKNLIDTLTKLDQNQYQIIKLDESLSSQNKEQIEENLKLLKKEKELRKFLPYNLVNVAEDEDEFEDQLIKNQDVIENDDENKNENDNENENNNEFNDQTFHEDIIQEDNELFNESNQMESTSLQLDQPMDEEEETYE
ncbi:uncharacterized protein KGF55_002502 [Candida pseudojiufengensis]|uniref:uncharacterized protein n=1 Tax=Candida pseudojiufengensis TaxID=497109 RepID=UPI00222463A4|nr:uncharacterized protein KGF55_002502 [Candida pseudojiufengensis]KAI5963622.1 hypothetical protein KGF55_002502 [Candida pseudojiufengensis]